MLDAINRTRRGAAKLYSIAHACRNLGRRMAHHQRHNAALVATGIHHTLNARLMRALAQTTRRPGLITAAFSPAIASSVSPRNARMVEANARNGNGDGIGRTRSIPAAAHANLKHGHVYGSLGKHSKPATYKDRKA